MSKYPIKKEFFPLSILTPPIQSAKMAGFLGSLMKPPRSIFRDKEIKVTKEVISGYNGAPIDVLLFEPYGIDEPTPCLVYYHGGGFFFGASGYHYRVAKRYALNTPCKLVFVQYRLAPKNPHPIPSEDCYAALRWTYENSKRLNIDKTRIAVGGDSAGGALAAAVCHMSRDRGTDSPLFQMLVYPVTDRRMETDSNRKYTDTPMWNSRLSVKMWQGYVQDENAPNLQYASPMEATDFAALPAAYIETAEFDCLHDEGVEYSKRLTESGVNTVLCETVGTMHGFDGAEKAPTSVMTVAGRIDFMKSKFYK